MKKLISILFLVSIVCSNFLFAEASGEWKKNLWGEGEIFKVDPVTDGILLGSGAFIYGTELGLSKGLKLGQDIFEGSILDLNSVNAFDRQFAKPYNKTIDKICDGIFVSSFALPAVLAFTDKSEWATCAAMYAETMLLAQGIKESIKLAVFRPRPYMYFAGWPEKDVIEEHDWANSFVSGHSTMSFAAATFASYTFSKYFPDSPWKYAVTFGSYSVATAVALMRVAGGCHFVTDIVSGAVLGTVCGFVVPWLHTLNAGKKEGPELSVLPLGFMITMNF